MSEKSIVKVEIPSWDQYFIGLAQIVALRSKDSQSKFGCVLVDEHNHIVGTGYNSFIRNMPDDQLPNTRPDKYKWMQHSETNALANLTVSPWQSKVRAYVSGRCCIDCVQKLANSNIKEIIYISKLAHMTLDQDQEAYDLVVKCNNMILKEVKFDNSWMKAILNEEN
jgi:dCMP deaminase